MPRKSDAKQQLRKYSLEQVQRYKRLFGTDDGKWVLADLEEEFRRRTSFDPERPYRTAYLEGERHVIETILERLRYDPKELIDAIVRHEQGDGI